MLRNIHELQTHALEELVESIGLDYKELFEQEEQPSGASIEKKLDREVSHGSALSFRKFLEVWNDKEKYKTLSDVSKALGNVSPRSLQRYAARARDIGLEVETRRPESQQRDEFAYTGSRGSSGSRASKTLNELLPGEFYSDQTRIPPRRWHAWFKFWKKRQSVPHPDGYYKDIGFKMIFLFGYEIEGTSIVYEAWFNNMDGTYQIYDKNGYAATQKNFSIMNDVVKAFMNLVSTEEEIDFDKLNTTDTRNFASSTKFSMSQARKETNTQKNESVSDVYDSDVQMILENTRATRSMIMRSINSELIDEYNETRLSKHLADKVSSMKAGRTKNGERIPFEFPPQKIGGLRGKVRRIRGVIKGHYAEGSFVQGFTFNDKIDIEIWYIRLYERTKDGRNVFRTYFEVYDLTSARRLGTEIPRISDALTLALRKIGAPGA